MATKKDIQNALAMLSHRVDLALDEQIQLSEAESEILNSLYYWYEGWKACHARIAAVGGKNTDAK